MENSNCNSCDSCNFCNSCNSCNYCDYCYSCNFCDSCDSCNFCDSCYSCNYCYSCDSCKNLKMTEYNYFCCAEEINKDGFQQKRYRIFNKEISKEEYNSITKIYDKLNFDKNENYNTRFKTAFKNMWNNLSNEGKQKYMDIPYFNWDIFTKITGIEKEEKKYNYDGKEFINKEELIEYIKNN